MAAGIANVCIDDGLKSDKSLGGDVNQLQFFVLHFIGNILTARQPTILTYLRDNNIANYTTEEENPPIFVPANSTVLVGLANSINVNVGGPITILVDSEISYVIDKYCFQCDIEVEDVNEYDRSSNLDSIGVDVHFNPLDKTILKNSVDIIRMPRKYVKEAPQCEFVFTDSRQRRCERGTYDQSGLCFSHTSNK